MPSNEHPDMSGNPMDDPDLCDQCERAISDFARFGTDLDEDKNFCSLECMEAYDEEHGKPLVSAEEMLKMNDYKWKRSPIENLQARAKWIDDYETACKDRDHLVSICNRKEVESTCLRWQVAKAIRVIERFLDIANLPLTTNMEKLVEPLEEFVVEAKAELKLWEDKK